jgi:hypothetical protein
MSEIEVLVDLLRAALPDVELKLDLPAEPGSPAWLDVERQGRIVAVEWRPRHGFGISLLDTSGPPQEGLFEGPDEILPTPSAARDSILHLLSATAGEDRPLRLAGRR